jgi:hypothetical protein
MSKARERLCRCDHFDEKLCPSRCQYLYQFRLDHIFPNADDYVRIMDGRKSKLYPKGYLKLSSCRRQKSVKVIGV